MKIIFITYAFFLCNLAFADDYQSFVNQATSYYYQKDFHKSVESFKEAFKIKQTSRLVLYNGACSAALAGNSNQAFIWLNLAFKNGWTNVRRLISDSDLASLHSNDQWKQLVAEMQKVEDKIEANYDKPLQAELLAILDDDQKCRLQFEDIEKKYGDESREFQDYVNKMQEVDKADLTKVAAILDKYGWVGPDKVGDEANSAIFLVIQHSDPATQEKYLPMMRAAVKEKKARASELALLEDRVAIGEGRRQIYGSQIQMDDKTRRYFVLPLDDPDNVDKRRAEVGLGPLADYVKRWDIVWDVDAYKKSLPEMEAKMKDDK